MMPALITKDRYSAGQDMNSSIFWKVNTLRAGDADLRF